MAVGDGVSALASLAVTFGGFSPTAMDGVDATREQIDKIQALHAQKKEAARRQRELELARTSRPREFVDGNGDAWVYVVVDDSVVRIVGGQAKSARVFVPESIEGKPVYAIGSDACSYNDDVVEITCPDTVEYIASCAFRFCKNLKAVRFPEKVSEFSGSWISNCDSVEEVVLPGMLEKITSAVLASGTLKKLHVGKHVRMIEPGALQKTQLELFDLDEGNAYFACDGDAVYTKDGTCLVAVVRPVASYETHALCTRVAKKAAFGLASLTHVKLNEGCAELAEFAFSNSGLEGFEAPSTLKVIGEKAFFYCESLASVKLNEGLKVIGPSAFRQTALAEIDIPGSIESIGASITQGSRVVHSGDDCSFRIAETSRDLFVDGKGGLYRHGEDGVHLIQLIDREMETYEVMEGCRVIDPYAFSYQEKIREVVVPEGVTSVGDSAFRICTRLESVRLPESLERIGDEAFLDTSLKEVRIPAAVAHLGRNAFVTYGAHHGDKRPSLSRIEVGEGNSLLYVVNGMLMRRLTSGSSVVLFSSSEPCVVLPPETVSIEDYAFNNARGIDYLELNPRLNSIGTSGLTTWCWIRHIHITLKEPLEGRTEFDFFFPDAPKSVHGICVGIGGASWVNVAGLMAQYDMCIAGAHDYNVKRKVDDVSAYEQVKLILGRLKDPVLLTPVNRDIYNRLIRNYLLEMCMDIARHDDREAMNDLADMGYLNEENLESVIERVGRLQDAAMTGYLLEMKRMRFNRSIIDFDL